MDDADGTARGTSLDIAEVTGVAGVARELTVFAARGASDIAGAGSPLGSDSGAAVELVGGACAVGLAGGADVVGPGPVLAQKKTEPRARGSAHRTRAAPWPYAAPTPESAAGPARKAMSPATFGTVRAWPSCPRGASSWAAAWIIGVMAPWLTPHTHMASSSCAGLRETAAEARPTAPSTEPTVTTWRLPTRSAIQPAAGAEISSVMATAEKRRLMLDASMPMVVPNRGRTVIFPTFPRVFASDAISRPC
mmetsp:Transcript_10212/g.18044  ORF Transcript_10212/g.18044 Transcript_10212/m.18044 type:complete len:250 (+) Transcript_10212:1339-2088(+)